ncbi:hypothetical protein BGW38_006418 [Lunasporangiospora selenospora]|uniref:Uncharacterized protein n=1 Tax=Lunasporangiospora selenospora TaxID=979761 RepID=A0A9P6G2L5_9FUNG|nr:hypothetical protein BGW38_006418 [Lunasporangiospora selenospora]
MWLSRTTQPSSLKLIMTFNSWMNSNYNRKLQTRRLKPMTQELISFHHSTKLPRLVVTDLDGTLLNPQHIITHRSIQALFRAQQQQQKPATASESCQDHVPVNGASDRTRIMIASGRSPRSIEKVIEQFQGIMVPDAVICCNGALNYNPQTKQISFPQFMDLDQVLTTVQDLREYIGQPRPMSLSKDEDLHKLADGSGTTPPESQDSATLSPGRPGFACEVIWFQEPSTGAQQSSTGVKSDVCLYGDNTYFVCDRAWEAQRKHTFYYDYQVVESMEDFVSSLGGGNNKSGTGHGRGGIIKLMALDRDRTAPEVYESLPSSLRNNESASATVSSKDTRALSQEKANFEVTYSGMHFLEMAAPGVSKGLGLQRYCEGHGIDRKDVIAFGDLLNDAEMLQYAGLGLCMGNGHPNMKALADRVIGLNSEDGLAKEIESWFI